jgi:hypothetical protein
MGFKDHPVFAEQPSVTSGADALIIRLGDRAVLNRAVPVAAALPVSDRTARQLARLDSGRWSTTDDAAGSDHVVIGMAGVFALRTRRLCGRVVATEGSLMHNGVGSTLGDEATLAARRVSGQLSRASGLLVTVRPVLVLECEQLVGSSRTLDVAVVASHRVRRWLERQPDTLDGAQAFRLRVAAGRTSTWR